jgi:hypothetical protein
VEQVLGAVIDYDAAHAGDLVTSMRVWLEHARRATAAVPDVAHRPSTGLGFHDS